MNRKELLIRHNLGKRELQKYQEELSFILKDKIVATDFIDLEMSDTLTQMFFNGYKSASKSFHKTYAGNENELDNDLKLVVATLRNEKAYLITKQSEICGILEIDVYKAIENYKKIVELDNDSLCLLSIDKDKGLYLDYYENDENDESPFKYQLSIWGWDVKI